MSAGSNVPGVYAQYNYAQWSVYFEDYDGNASSLYFMSDSQFYKRTKVFGGNKYSLVIMMGENKGKDFYCRTEGDSIMRYDETEGAEFVLFDFSLNVGDLFTCKDGTEFIVYEVKDTLFKRYNDTNPISQQIIKLYNKNNPSQTDVWLKDFGSLKTSILLPSELGTDMKDSFVPWWDNDYEETTYQETESGKFKGNIVNYLGADNERRADSLHCELLNDTLVVSGRIRTFGSKTPYLSCVTDGNKISFWVDGGPGKKWLSYPSIYFNNKFPGFKPGEYTLSYDNRISITFDSERSYDIPVLWGEVKNRDEMRIKNVTVTCYEGTSDDVENTVILGEGKTDWVGLYTMYLNLPHDTELTEKDFTGKPISVMVKADGYQTQFITDGVICGTRQDFILKELPSKAQCDINKDGKVDITDVVGVVNTIAGDTRYKDTSDVNSDGRTDITDVVDIINVIAM